MISRVWHGWTTHENADVYENLLRTEIFGGIFAKKIPGFERIELFRRTVGAEIEFMTIMWFASIDSVKAFVGEDYEVAYVPLAARTVLKRFDARSQHYEAKIARTAGVEDERE